MSDRPAVSRRRLLAAASAAVALPTAVGAAGGSATAASDADVANQQETFRIESHVNGWEGVAPESIAGERNPTLRLTEGEEYEIVWENVDGVDHNLLLKDGEGETVAQTEIVGGEGETRSISFVATEALSNYRCGIHAGSMEGEIAFGEVETTTEETTETAAETTTETAAETTMATEATDETTAGDADDANGADGGDGSDGGGQPGFGLLAAAAGLLGGLGLRRRRD